MLIVNPLYDQAFKYLMENEEMAKRVISIITEKKVLNISPKPQEVKVILNRRNDIALSRFDFKATIEDESGEVSTVLIEIQKSGRPEPIPRFRRYLGKSYIAEETIINAEGEEEKRALPIITVYILGYTLAEYDFPGVLVDNRVYDATTKEEISHKNDFVKLLTHPSYILQIERLRPERKTKLERFMAFFDQSQKTDNKFFLDLDPELSQEADEDLDGIAKYLNRGTLDEELILELELEEEYEAEFERMESKYEEMKEQLVKEAEEKKRMEEELAKEAEEKEKLMAQAEASKEIIRMLARQLLQSGQSVSVISQMTGLSEEEINNLRS